jgi:hypothetical protein
MRPVREDIALTIVDATADQLTLELAEDAFGELGGDVVYTLYLDDIAQSATVTLRDYIEQREVRGVRAEYAYTTRVAQDETNTWYTRLRQQPDKASTPIGMLSNNDTVDILDDTNPEWYEVRIRASTHEDVINNIGWIERWLVDDTGVPSPPTATATAAPRPVATAVPRPVATAVPRPVATTPPVAPTPPSSGPDEY